MGDPKHLSRKYDVPRKQWDKERIIADRKIMIEYGLRTKKELWKAETELRKIRNRARSLLAGLHPDYDKRKNELINKLIKLGIFTKDNKIEDALKLKATDFLDRRLETVTFRKGLASTVKQARQLIVHGHIAVNGVKRTAPSSLIKFDDSISYTNTHMKDIIDKIIKDKGKEVVTEKSKEEVKE